MLERLITLSADTAWLLQNSCRFAPYEETLNKYDLHFRQAGFRVGKGKTKHQEIHVAFLERFGAEFLQTLNAYDETHVG